MAMTLDVEASDAIHIVKAKIQFCKFISLSLFTMPKAMKAAVTALSLIKMPIEDLDDEIKNGIKDVVKTQKEFAPDMKAVNT